jgi:hypothetical protein
MGLINAPAPNDFPKSYSLPKDGLKLNKDRQ